MKKVDGLGSVWRFCGIVSLKSSWLQQRFRFLSHGKDSNRQTLSGGLTANGITINISHTFRDIQPNFELDISLYRLYHFYSFIHFKILSRFKIVTIKESKKGVSFSSIFGNKKSRRTTLAPQPAQNIDPVGRQHNAIRKRQLIPFCLGISSLPDLHTLYWQYTGKQTSNLLGRKNLTWRRR